jgi:hypothetical protein
MNALKGVPPAMVRRDPLILDPELVAHPFRDFAAGRIAASAITIQFQYREQRPFSCRLQDAVDLESILGQNGVHFTDSYLARAAELLT